MKIFSPQFRLFSMAQTLPKQILKMVSEYHVELPSNWFNHFFESFDSNNCASNSLQCQSLRAHLPVYSFMLSVIGAVLLVASVYDLVVVRKVFGRTAACTNTSAATNEVTSDGQTDSRTGQYSAVEDAKNDDVMAYAEGHRGEMGIIQLLH